MKHPSTSWLPALLLALLLAASTPARSAAAPQSPAEASTTTPSPDAQVLDRTAAGPILPSAVFFRGQTATIQARNSAGLRRQDGALLLTALVDTAGYSSALQQTYQAYLLTEFPLQFGAQRLPPGAYGFGFIEGDRMVLMDIGGHRLLETPTTRDPALLRPNPLQILPAPRPGAFRLYLGRTFVTLTPAVDR